MRTTFETDTYPASRDDNSLYPDRALQTDIFAMAREEAAAFNFNIEWLLDRLETQPEVAQ